MGGWRPTARHRAASHAARGLPSRLRAASPLAFSPHPCSLLAAAHPSSRQGQPRAGPLQDCPPAGPLQGGRALEGNLAWEAHRKTFHPQAQQASPPRQGFAGTPIARRTRHAARAITQVRACTCIRLLLVRARTPCAIPRRRVGSPSPHRALSLTARW